MSGAMLKLAAIPPLVWTALVVLTLAACGVPATSPPTAITEVPYNLMETAAPPTPQRTTPADAVPSSIGSTPPTSSPRPRRGR